MSPWSRGLNSPKYAGRTAMEPKYIPAVPSSLSTMYECQVVISRATMMSSLRTSAVNDIATICRNSDSKSSSESSMMIPPAG